MTTSRSSAPGRRARGRRTCSRARGARVTIFDRVASAREAVRRRRHRPRAGTGCRRRSTPPAGRPSIIRSARFIDTPRGRSAVVALTDHDNGAVAVDALARWSWPIAPTFDAPLLAAAERAGARLDRSRVTDVIVDARRRVASTRPAGRRTASFVIGADGANSLVRRRVAAPFRRDQLSIATGFFAHGVTSDEIVDRADRRSAGLHLVVPAADAPGDRHLRAGRRRRRPRRRCAQQAARWIAATRIADGARLEPYSWPIPSLSAADLDALRARRAALGARRRRRRPRRSDHARRHLLRARLGQLDRRARSTATTSRVYAARVRDEAIARARARRAAQGRLLPPGVHRAADARAARERRDPRRDGRSRRRAPELSVVEMAAAPEPSSGSSRSRPSAVSGVRAVSLCSVSVPSFSRTMGTSLAR